MFVHDLRGSEEIVFGMTCRGAGKIIVELICPNLNVVAWKVASHTKAGTSLPASVITLPGGTTCMVVPLLTVTQHVTLAALDEAGVVLTQTERSIRPAATKAEAILSSRKDIQKAGELRYAASLTTDEHLALTDIALVPCTDDRELIQATLTLQDASSNLEEHDIRIAAVLNDGTVTTDGGAFVLCDLTQPVFVAPGKPGCIVYTRTLRVSVAVPTSATGVCLWVRCPSGGYRDSFVALEPLRLNELRAAARAFSTAAEVSPDYEAWFFGQRSGYAELQAQVAEQATFALHPTFSLVIPLYHTPLPFFWDVIASVRAQTYPEFELILINSTPDDQELCAAITEAMGQDDRIRLVTLAKNLGITENTNAGIEVATGDFIGFMDHDDIIEPDLLYWYARGINDHPTTDMLYCDEDMLADGHYISPMFKPDWSPLKLESTNYVCHLLAVRRSICQALPKPDSRFDGAQDHNMTLAVGERARYVHHVGKVLYHWRAHPLSTAQNGEAKPESIAAGKLAIDTHFARIGFDAAARPIDEWPHSYTVVCNEEAPHTVTLLHWGDRSSSTVKDTNLLLPDGWDIERIDLGATAAETAWDALQQALDSTTGEIVVLMRCDARPLEPGWLPTLAAYALRDDVDLVAPRLLYRDGTICSLGYAYLPDGQLINLGQGLYRTQRHGRGSAWFATYASSLDARCVVTTRDFLQAQARPDTATDIQGIVEALCAGNADTEPRVAVVSTVSMEVGADLGECAPNKAQTNPCAATVPLYYHPSYDASGSFGLAGKPSFATELSTLQKIAYKLRY